MSDLIQNNYFGGAERRRKIDPPRVWKKVTIFYTCNDYLVSSNRKKFVCENATISEAVRLLVKQEGNEKKGVKFITPGRSVFCE